jgi:Caspase domain
MVFYTTLRPTIIICALKGWMLRAALGAVLVLGFVSAALAAEPARRVALVIGNSEYAAHSMKLANPANDAAAMNRALQDAGFETVVKLNVKRVDFYRAVTEFAAKLIRDPRTVGLFYYAGHGVQADGENYLIPVDAVIESDADLEANAFPATRVLSALKGAQNDMNIVILDACRDNPLPHGRSVARGLARMGAPSGTFIAYAAAPGQSANDGASGTNGVFTGELIKAMAEPGVPLEQMFKHVIAGVRSSTGRAQEPWSEASLQGDFYFHAAMAVVPQPAPSGAPFDPRQLDLAFWESIKDSKDLEDYRSYLKKFPQGEFSPLAAARLKVLDAQRPTAARPTPPKPSAAAASILPPAKKPPGKQCASILDRVQLGDTLNDEERAYIARECQ